MRSKPTKRWHLGAGLAATGLLAFGQTAPAGTGDTNVAGKSSPPDSLNHSACWSHGRVDGHAPIGVMFDHTHRAGGFMIGYRFMYAKDKGMIQGSQDISNSRVFELGSGHQGNYRSVPLSMDMYMHMLDIMFAPTDWLTLMVMPQYMEMDMTMQSRGGHGHGHGTRTMGHSTSGWSDTIVAGLVPVYEGGMHGVHLGLALGLPTGSVNEKHHGSLTHYDMQLGSGTWDALPSLTYRGAIDRLSWGGQVLATLRLEGENSSGYRLGDVWESTAWAAVRATDWMSVSGRVLWRNDGEIRGHYNAPHGHGSPPDIQENYGGDRVDLGVGINLMVPTGILKGWRVAGEVLWPVYEKSNGVSLKRDTTLYLGVQKGW